MKKVVSLSILAVILIFGVVFLYNQFAGATFEEVVLNKVDVANVTSIELIRSPGDKEVEITEPEVIKALVGDFSEMKIEKADITNVDFDQSYWILLNVESERRIGFTYYDSGYLSLYDYQNEKNNGNYKIKKELIGGLEEETIAALFRD